MLNVETETLSVAGAVIAVEVVTVQPFASVAVTWYDPDVSPAIAEPVFPPVHTYEYGALPPDTSTLADPSAFPAQLAFARGT